MRASGDRKQSHVCTTFSKTAEPLRIHSEEDTNDVGDGGSGNGGGCGDDNGEWVFSVNGVGDDGDGVVISTSFNGQFLDITLSPRC